jgi:radical SAM protein with 4Fe4S-binding SPASM domain
MSAVPIILQPKLVGAELELTTMCPYRCVTCGTAAGEPRSRELTLVQWLAVVDELEQLGCQRITLLGGEPLCFTEWPTIVRHATSRSMAVEVVTSGHGVTEDLARVARESGLASITVSVDGTEASHDTQRRRAGSYRQALRAITLLDQAGLRVGVTTQVNTLSLPTLVALAPELQQAGALGWQVQLTFPLGRAKESGLALPPERIPELRSILRMLATRRGLRPFLTDSIGYCSHDDIRLRTPQGGRARPFLQCLAGLRHVGITSDGAVKGCLALWDGSVEGRLEEESLATIWNDPNRFAYTRRFTPSNLSGPCAECPQGAFCRGGCTAVALAFHGKPGISQHCFRLFPEPSDPRCAVTPNLAECASKRTSQ